MLKENGIKLTSLYVFIILNLIYFSFMVLNIIEGVFAFWAVLAFAAVTPFILKDKRNAIIIIVFLIPLEISKAFIPILQVVETAEGSLNSVFDFSRLFMLYSFVVWFITDLKSFVPYVKHRVSFYLLLFVIYYLVSAVFISPAMMKGLNETLRYVIYFFFFTMTIQFINKPEDYLKILKTVVIIAVILSLEGISEFVFNYHLWEDAGRRATATFMDPNIFARFLNIVICSLLILRLKKIHIFRPVIMDISLMVCLIALMFTVSRQGWMILFVSLFFISFFLEKKHRNRVLLGLLAVGIMAIPVMLQLLEIRQKGLEMYDIGTRIGLLIGGGLMFLSNPLFGIGASGFQTAMIQNYLEYLPWGINSPTLSHTYLVTVLAELGILGFIILVLILYFSYKQFISNYRQKDPNIKTLSIITLVALVIILIGSQAEGRFFEGPFIWLFLGLNISVGKMAIGKEKEQLGSG